jgi:ECF transporter S component (folate family)
MQKLLRKLFFTELLDGTTKTQKIAYISLMTAMCVVCNMFFEFKLADTQFSLTLFFSAMTGMIIGPVFGFTACFLGDLVGFLYNSAGFMYMPWIGLSMGIIALISGLIMNCVDLKSKFKTYLKISMVCVLTFLLCTIAINTTAFWIIYNTRKVPYTAYLVTRLFVQGQIWNSVFNYALLFVFYPVILRIKSAITTNKNN